MGAVEKLANQSVLAPPPLPELKLTSLTSLNLTDRTRSQLRHMGMRAAFVEPWIVTARAIVRWRNANITSLGRVAVSRLGQAAVATTTLLRQAVSGAAYDAALALDKSTGAVNISTPWRLWPRLFGGLSNWATVLQTELGHVAQLAWHSGPSDIFALVSKLAAQSTEAAARRDKIATLASYVSVGVMTEWYAARSNQSLDVASFGSTSTVRGVDIPCLSPYSDLCSGCLYLDQMIGTLIGSVLQAVAFYTGDVTTEPSLAFSKARYQDFKAYLADPLAPAVFGDSDDLPPRWPYPGLSAYRWFGDATPNKIRFSDLDSLWTTLWGGLVAGFDTATQDTLGTTVSATGVNETSVTHFRGQPRASLNRRLAGLFRLAMQSLPELDRAVVAQEEALVAMGVDMTEDQVANLTVRGWGEFIYATVRTCSYRQELDGSMKRFSIGEALLISGAVGIAAGALAAVPLFGLGVSSVSAAIGTGLLVATAATVVVGYDWSYR